MESPPQTPGAEEDSSFQLSHITFALTFGNDYDGSEHEDEGKLVARRRMHQGGIGFEYGSPWRIPRFYTMHCEDNFELAKPLLKSKQYAPISVARSPLVYRRKWATSFRVLSVVAIVASFVCCVCACVVGGRWRVGGNCIPAPKKENQKA
eukprot:scaffold11101_cov106-Skeletonema_dohrnii-CCMP3373.AAC.3